MIGGLLTIGDGFAVNAIKAQAQSQTQTRVSDGACSSSCCDRAGRVSAWVPENEVGLRWSLSLKRQEPDRQNKSEPGADRHLLHMGREHWTRTTLTHRHRPTRVRTWWLMHRSHRSVSTVAAEQSTRLHLKMVQVLFDLILEVSLAWRL